MTTPRRPRTDRVPQGSGWENWHGTNGGYTNHRCGCKDCKRAHAIYQKSYDRARRRVARTLAALPDQGDFTSKNLTYEAIVGISEEGPGAASTARGMTGSPMEATDGSPRIPGSAER